MVSAGNVASSTAIIFDDVDSSEALETGRTRYTQWQKHLTKRDLRIARYYLAAAVTQRVGQASVVLTGLRIWWCTHDSLSL